MTIKKKTLKFYFNNPMKIFSTIGLYLDYYFFDIIITSYILIIFTFSPRSLLKIYKKRGLFNLESLNNNPEKHWIYANRNKVIFKEVNILCKGNSLKNNLGKIEKGKITFAVNFENSLNKFKKIYGITASEKAQRTMFIRGFIPSFVIRRFLKIKKNKVIWSKILHPYPKKNKKISKKFTKLYTQGIANNIIFKQGIDLNTGSALASIMSIAPLAKKINIYGWDHYFRKNILNYSYLQIVLEMCRMDGSYPVDLYGVRRREMFVQSIVNLYYFGKLVKMKKYNIKSNLTKINMRKELMNKINLVMS